MLLNLICNKSFAIWSSIEKGIQGIATNLSISLKKNKNPLFWDYATILFIVFEELLKAAKATYYASLLYNFKDNIRVRPPGKLTKMVRLLYDKIIIHIATDRLSTIETFTR